MSNFNNTGSIQNQAGAQHFQGPVNFVTNTSSSSSVSEDNAILRSLAFPEMLDRRANIGQPHPGSCDWILDLDAFTKWRSDPHGMLWIKGKPGSGKSTLMTFLYDKLKKDRDTAQRDDIYLDFFFSARGTEMQHTPLGMLRSLLNQLFSRDESIRPAIREVFREKCDAFGKSDEWRWQRAELEHLLRSAVAASASRRAVNIFVDALDEAGEMYAQELAKFFCRIHDLSSSLVFIKILFSCRHYPVPSRLAAIEVHVEKHNSQAIEGFVNKSLLQDDLGDVATDDADHSLLRDLKAEICSKAEGVFQWTHLIVALVKSLLYDGHPLSEICQRVRQIPSDLIRMYEHVFCSVMKKDSYALSLHLFQWVCFAMRPLTVREMRYAIAAQEKHLHPYSQSGRTIPAEAAKADRQFWSRIKALSAGLVEVIVVKGDNSKDHMLASSEDQEIVQVIHQSVQEYILNGGLVTLSTLAKTASPKMRLEIQHDGGNIVPWCHTVLYRSCLYLLKNEYVRDGMGEMARILSGSKTQRRNLPEINYIDGSLGSHDSPDSALEFRPDWIPRAHWSYGKDHMRNFCKWFPLIGYALARALHHAEKAFPIRLPEISKEAAVLQQILFGNPTSAAIYEDELRTPSGDGRPYSKLIHAASYHKLDNLVDHLAHEGADLDAEDYHGRLPLHLAAIRGHRVTASLLTRLGADRNVKDETGSTPLSLAAAAGHMDFVTWLLNGHGTRKAPSHVCIDEQAAALNAAARSGHTAIVRHLVQAGVPVRRSSMLQESALINAAAGGHTNVVKLLLDEGADVNDRDLTGSTALHLACSFREHGTTNSTLEVVKELLSKGADVHAYNDYHITALHQAAALGNEAVVKILLGNNAHVDALDLVHGTSLLRAMSKGDVGTIKALIDAGADVNWQSKFEPRPLLEAYRRGHLDVAQLLLQAGANVTVGDVLALRPWRPTYSKGFVEAILKTAASFVDAGAEPDSAEKIKYSQLLQQLITFSARLDADLVQKLLAAGASVNTIGRSGTALSSELRNPRIDLKKVRLLLDAGADVNLMEPSGTALQTLCQNTANQNQETILQMLLVKGADVNATSGKTTTSPLIAACRQGIAGEQLVQKLLLAGAGVNTQDDIFGSALQAAVSAVQSPNALIRPLLPLEPTQAPIRPSPKVPEMLLRAKADFDLAGGIHGHALQAACLAEERSVALLLLDAGTYVHAQGGINGNALTAACIAGRVELVRRLLDLKVDVNTRGGFYGNALQAACLQSFPEVVDILLDAGADVNAYGGEHGTALQAATSAGHKEVIKRLLARDVDVNIEFGDHANALYLACNQEGHHRNLVHREDVALLLLEAGCDPNSGIWQRESTLQAAARNGMRRVVKALLDAGADINFQSGRLGTALHVASCYGQLDILQDLLAAGADVNVEAGIFGNVLQAACSPLHDRQPKPILQALLEAGANVESKSGKYGTALVAACANCKISLVRLLLDAGADVNAPGSRDYGNPLSAVSRALKWRRANQKRQIVSLLLDRGADVNAHWLSPYITTALQAACWADDVRVARLLLEAGADVNAPGGYFGHALQVAATRSVQSMELLIEAGANLDAQGGELGNALQAACFGSRKITLEMLRLGADVNAEGGRFGSPLQASCASNHQRVPIVPALLAAGAQVNSAGGIYGNALQAAAACDADGMLLSLLLDAGADVRAKGGRYNTALQAAATARNVTTVKLLIKAGAEVNERGGLHGSALHAACFHNDYESANLLLQAGADANSTSSKYSSPLAAVFALEKYDVIDDESVYTRADLVRLLLNAGANANAPGSRSANPLQMACHAGDVVAVELLLEADADAHAVGKPFGTALRAVLTQDPRLLLNSQGEYEEEVADLRRLRIMKILIEAGVDVNARGGKCEYPLEILLSAPSRYTSERVLLLLKAGADPNCWSKAAGSALQAALAALTWRRSCNDIVVSLLLKAGADVNARKWKVSGTALHYATSVRDHRAIQLLLQAGADPTIPDDAGQLPLHVAAQNGIANVVEQLCTRINVDQTDLFGRTPLHLAVYHGQGETVSKLLALGADLSHRDGYGKTARDWVTGQPRLEKIMNLDLAGREWTLTSSSEVSLASSVVRVATQLLTKDDVLFRPGFDELGHCLLYLGETNDASFSFEQQITSTNSSGASLHDVVCRACNRRPSDRPILGVRYICRTCPDTNLCSICMRRYRKRPHSTGCHNHEFLEVGRAAVLKPDVFEYLKPFDLFECDLDNYRIRLEAASIQEKAELCVDTGLLDFHETELRIESGPSISDKVKQWLQDLTWRYGGKCNIEKHEVPSNNSLVCETHARDDGESDHTSTDDSEEDRTKRLRLN